jgi:flavin-dependent dehydrogenase
MAKSGMMPLDRAARDPWDVIVIGAGPAGALSATLLARAGLKVLLVERRALPRHKVCGGCLNASALASLDRAALLPRVRAIGAAPVCALHLHQRGRSAVLDLPPGLAVSRYALDEALAAAAAEAGCALLTETTALVAPEGAAPPDGGWRHVGLQSAQGGAVTIRGRAVIVADGLGHSSLRDLPGFQSRVSSSSRIGIGGEADAGAIATERGAITMAVSPRGYVGAIDIEGGRVNIAAAVDPPFLKASGGPAGAVRAILAHAGVHMNAALESIDWMGTLPLTRRLVGPPSRGVFVVGDAAGYVEPFTGEGMAWAFAGAEGVVPFVRGMVASSGTAAAREWTAWHARIIGREQRWCRVIANGLRRPALVSALVALVGRHPGLAAPVLAHFSPRVPMTPERSA